MSSKFTNAVALTLFAAAVPLNATAEMMSLAEYLASKPEPATSTNSAADENPFENLSFELPTAPPDAEPFPESGLQPNRIEMPPTPGSPARLPSVFVIVESGTAGDYVREIVCQPDTTVGSALKTASLPATHRLQKSQDCHPSCEQARQRRFNCRSRRGHSSR